MFDVPVTQCTQWESLLCRTKIKSKDKKSSSTSFDRILIMVLNFALRIRCNNSYNDISIENVSAALLYGLYAIALTHAHILFIRWSQLNAKAEQKNEEENAWRKRKQKKCCSLFAAAIRMRHNRVRRTISVSVLARWMNGDDHETVSGLLPAHKKKDRVLFGEMANLLPIYDGVGKYRTEKVAQKMD